MKNFENRGFQSDHTKPLTFNRMIQALCASNKLGVFAYKYIKILKMMQLNVDKKQIRGYNTIASEYLCMIELKRG